MRFQEPFEAWEMVYAGFTGYRKRVLRFGDSVLHHLNPVELRPGMINSADITYWRKIELDPATIEELDEVLERVKRERLADL